MVDSSNSQQDFLSPAEYLLETHPPRTLKGWIALVVVPYGTDAPLYHLPVMTITLVVLNILMFFAAPIHELATGTEQHPLEVMIEALLVHDTEPSSEYELQFGAGLKPWQWISSSFLHASLLHLLGNMLFLGLFGLIVEGKLGWWKFLSVYLGICAVSGFLAQGIVGLLNPGYDGAALGASAAICGLMAICILWAPLNHIQIVLNLYYCYNWHYDIPIAAFAGFFLIIDILSTLFFAAHSNTFIPFTAFLHTCGTLVGAAVGVAFLKLNWVDCDGFDAFTVIEGRHERTQYRGNEQDHSVTPSTMTPERGLQQIQEILEGGDQPRLAYRAHVSMIQKNPDWHLPDREFLLIIQQLCRQQHHDEAVRAMREYLKTPRAKQDQVRLKLAALLIDPLQHPSQAINILQQINFGQLSPKERTLYRNAQQRAQQLQNAGVVDTLPFEE